MIIVPPPEPLSEHVSVSLTASMKDALAAYAKAHKTTMSALVRGWIGERL